MQAYKVYGTLSTGFTCFKSLMKEREAAEDAWRDIINEEGKLITNLFLVEVH